MESVHIKLTYDELDYVIKLLQHELKPCSPSEQLDRNDIVNVFREHTKERDLNQPLLCPKCLDAYIRISYHKDGSQLFIHEESLAAKRIDECCYVKGARS